VRQPAELTIAVVAKRSSGVADARDALVAEGIARREAARG
jgi:hypothetical protein